MRRFSVITAVGEGGGIGFENKMPWSIPADVLFFRKTTTHVNDKTKRNAIIMGRKTWDSLHNKPLPLRLNVVISSKPVIGANIMACDSLTTALKRLATDTTIETVFVIGGAQVYAEAMSTPFRSLLDRVFLTRVDVTSTSVTNTGNSASLNPSQEIKTPNIPSTSVTATATASTATATATSIPFPSTTANAAPTATAASTAAMTFEDKTLIRYDTFFPMQELQDMSLVSSSVVKNCEFQVYEPGPVNHAEHQYLDLVQEIVSRGIVKSDRTGVGTRSVFGRQMRFSLRDHSFPLLTTKVVYWKGIVEELLWMLRGSTNSQELDRKQITIWNDNGSRAFLDKSGFPQRKIGDLGPVYGFQWRHCGAKYIDATTDYKGQGVDQIAEIIRLIKTSPDSRRIVLSAWNPSDLHLMVLPPCHAMAQFTVTNGELSCLMFQRSCDMGLGVPFNIASYSLLTVLLAHVCGLKPGEFVYTLGDAHVYENHVSGMLTQLKRRPRSFPVLRIKCDPKSDPSLYSMQDLELSNYTPYSSIKLKMAV